MRDVPDVRWECIGGPLRRRVPSVPSGGGPPSPAARRGHRCASVGRAGPWRAPTGAARPSLTEAADTCLRGAAAHAVHGGVRMLAPREMGGRLATYAGFPHLCARQRRGPRDVLHRRRDPPPTR
ncbi:hypothetical protein CCE01nite_03060 [Cellulomonas cellasea]|uniref:Uncharacterized protein n=1 Tax=Cellulomonas cellasea TaxID=43670 RepID=A0A4Y3KQZ1_9CELL|nr:hypothetical protein CCE01nite_03060 [Cellulomonas cellasea]